MLTKFMYEITFDLPDVRLDGNTAPLKAPAEIAPTADDNDTPGRCYPLRSCRSVVGHQPHDSYAPRMTLHAGEVQAHSSVLDTRQLASMTKKERFHKTTWS
jgi:hypothetical protein